MNLARMRKLRDVIARVPPDRFNMSVWVSDSSWFKDKMGSIFRGASWKGLIRWRKKKEQEGVVDPLFSPECGTQACLAGWTVLAFANEDDRSMGPSTAARRILDLTDEQASNLFYGRWHTLGTGYRSHSKEQAVKELDYLIAEEEERRQKANAEKRAAEVVAPAPAPQLQSLREALVEATVAETVRETVEVE